MKDWIADIEHRINPLHVYCRFVEGGLEKPTSMAICRLYEKYVFSWLSWLMGLAFIMLDNRKK